MSRRRASGRGMRIFMGLIAVLLLLAVVRMLTVAPRPGRPFLADDHPVILAHQGASGHAPTNTLKAFQLGLQQGADILELDVHLTRDGQVVVIHDATVDRTSNGSGQVKEMTLAELRALDFGYKFSADGGQTYPYRGKGIVIPTLEEVIEAFPGVRLNIEIKQVEPAMEEAVWALIRRHGLEEQVLINSFHGEVGSRWVALAGDRVAVGANRQDMYRFAGFYLTGLGRLYNPTVDAFQLPTSQKLGPVKIALDSPRLIRLAKRLNIKVHYWTINQEDEMRRLLQLGADGLITDYPDRAYKVMRELGMR